MAADASYTFAPDAEPVLEVTFESARRSSSFGNARFARRLFEQAIEQQAVRLATTPDLRSDPSQVSLLTGADVKAAAGIIAAR